MDVLLVNPKQRIPPMDFAMAFPPVPLIDLAGMIPDHHVEILDLKVEDLSYSNPTFPPKNQNPHPTTIHPQNFS